MNHGTLEKIAELAQQIRYCFIATADQKGLPHVTAAGGLALQPDRPLSVTSWFCPWTIANLRTNRRISLVVWDTHENKGFQVLGELEGIKDLGMLDGYIPGMDEQQPRPQVEREFLVRAEKVLEFKHGPHSDREEWHGHR